MLPSLAFKYWTLLKIFRMDNDATVEYVRTFVLLPIFFSQSNILRQGRAAMFFTLCLANKYQIRVKIFDTEKCTNIFCDGIIAEEKCFLPSLIFEVSAGQSCASLLTSPTNIKTRLKIFVVDKCENIFCCSISIDYKYFLPCLIFEVQAGQSCASLLTSPTNTKLG